MYLCPPSTADLLQLINTTFVGVEDFIQLAVAALEKILVTVNPDSQEKLRDIISQALAEVLEIMEVSIWFQLIFKNPHFKRKWFSLY